MNVALLIRTSLLHAKQALYKTWFYLFSEELTLTKQIQTFKIVSL